MAFHQRYIDMVAPLVVAEFSIPERAERRMAAPRTFQEGALGDWLQGMIGSQEMWRHQRISLDAIAAGDNLVIATRTASGKSLSYIAPIVAEMLLGSGTVIITFPTKALGGDQLARLHAAVELAGLPRHIVGEINGDIPMHERTEVLERCRIILMTPDVIHSWIMRQANAPAVQAFLARLRFFVIDETHIYEGIFGSNAAYLFRRLLRLHLISRRRLGCTGRSAQIIAASATIREPASHLQRLTGLPFTAVTEADNGAPFHGLTMLHLDGPGGSAGEQMAADLCRSSAEGIAPHAFILFADSRQGVERISRQVNREDVLPYRGGYSRGDRRIVEEALRDQRLHGVVATSSLELGIDIPQFTIGMNLGVPATRKAFHQRIGRIGRATKGLFATIAPATAFTRLGGTFREFYDAEVEPCHLYLENRLVQFQAARCLLEECWEGEELADAA